MNAAVTTDFDNVSATSKVHAVASSRTTTNRLHPGVLGIGALAYTTIIATFWIGFSNSAPVFAISIGIVVVCLVAFLGLPYFMGRHATKFWARHGRAEKPAGSLRQFLDGKFETADGTVSGAGALALVVTVPVSLALGTIAMAIIRHTV